MTSNNTTSFWERDRKSLGVGSIYWILTVTKATLLWATLNNNRLVSKPVWITMKLCTKQGLGDTERDRDDACMHMRTHTQQSLFTFLQFPHHPMYAQSFLLKFWLQKISSKYSRKIITQLNKIKNYQKSIHTIKNAAL